jgi:hypothetical protein
MVSWECPTKPREASGLDPEAVHHDLTAETPRESIVNAINMGRDTDTVGAVTGAVAGARFGADELPDDWIQSLTVDKNGRRLPNWWPDPDSTAAELRTLASELLDL